MGSTSDSLSSDVVIVGAGFGGCYLLHLLRKNGFKTQILEAASTIGGVWAWNRYPGARVDMELPYYGFSDPAIWNSFHWTERYSSDKELRAYFQHVANVWDLHKDIKLNIKVMSAIYDESTAMWDVNTEDNQVFRCRWLIAATGTSYKKYIPEWKGLEGFGGTIYHSAHWPEEPVPLERKRIAVIGSGSTGLQVLQETSKMCPHVTHFVRTPNIAIPMHQRVISEDEWNAHKPFMSHVFEGCRATRGGIPTSDVGLKFSSEDANSSKARMEEGWKRGGLHWLASLPETYLVDPKVNHEAYDFWCQKTRQRIRDSVKRDILAPLEQPYYINAKRPGLEQDYYESCDQENVTVTNSPIVEFTKSGILTKDGTHHEFDIVIACTGYDAVTGGLRTMNIKGRNGIDLDEKWRDGIITHLGIFAHDFPNFCMVYGPQAPTSLTNGPVFLEIQCEYILKVITCQREEHIKTIEPKVEAEQAWREHVIGLADQTLFTTGNSWYNGGNIPGKRKEFLLYIGGIPLYTQKMEEAFHHWDLIARLTLVECYVFQPTAWVFVKVILRYSIFNTRRIKSLTFSIKHGYKFDIEAVMLDTLYNMLAPSPRSSKRQKLDRDATQETKSPKVQRHATKLANASSSATQDPRAKEVVRTQQHTIDTDNGAKSDFIDSAYHSMGTSPEEAADDGNENTTTTVHSGEHGKRADDHEVSTPTRSRKRKEKSGTKHLDELDRVVTSKTNQADEQEHDKSENGSNAAVVRTSGRTRTKTWKSVEIEAKPQKASSQHKPKRGANNGSSTVLSVPLDRKSRTGPHLSSPSTKFPGRAETKKPNLRMPSKRPQLVPAEKDLDQPEDEVLTALTVPEPNPLMQDKSSIDDIQSPKKRKARSSGPSRIGHKKVQSPPPISTQNSAARVTQNTSVLDTLLADDEYREIMVSMKEHIMRYLTSTGPLPLCGEDHHAAYRKVYQILEQTVSAGEGNSMLLIGARGTAKTTLTNMALEELNTEFENQFHVVRLNGFIHTDDKLALKEICRQLGREMAIEDSSQTDRVNYADTMASLLALLSQPEELSNGDGTRTTSKSVIFILDEFDLFTTHSRQTLLYNLFDIAQSRKAPIAVIGLTTRIDIVESLEKRVKSRFSHRYTYVSHPQSFSAYTSLTRAFLLASAHDEAGTLNQVIKSPALSEIRSQFSAKFSEVYREWSTHIEQLFADQSVLLLLKRHYSQTKSPQAFLNTFLLPIMKLPSLPQPADLLINGLCPPDSNLDFLPSLSDASLALLIAAARLDIVCDTDTVTFNMAYDEYVRLAQRSRTTASASGMIAISASTSGGSKTILSRDIALTAWEHLEELGLLLPIAGQGGFSQTQGAMVDLGRGGRLVRVDVGLEEIGAAPGLELGAMARWCKEI